jgi:hypothetical protein
MGCSLLQFTPMSDERRQAFDREAEKERLQAEAEAEARESARAEHLGELRMRGVVPTSVEERLQIASFGQDREDAAEARRVKAGDEQRGNERAPRLNRLEMEREQREAAAKAARTPASQSDLSKLAGKLGSLTSSVNLLKRRRSAEQDYHEPRDYVRNSGGHIIRGPY